MAPPLLFDISALNPDELVYDVAGIEAINPHRGPMRQLDGVFYEQDGRLAAVRDIRHDEFWVDGHIPGRPLFPGVLMIEAAAQLSSFYCLKRMADVQFMGFAGVDGVKFRGQVKPGDRLIVLVQEIEFRRRRCVCDSQGVVDGTLVFEARITGMPI